MTLVRQRWVRGAVVSVPLDDRYHVYAQMLESPEYAFFDCRTLDKLTAREAAALPVLFRLWVTATGHSQGRWRKVGSAPVPPALQVPVRRYNQDILRPQNILLTLDGRTGSLVSPAECDGFECAAVWGAQSVEDRVRSHYAGVPDRRAVSLRPKVVMPNRALRSTGGGGVLGVD